MVKYNVKMQDKMSRLSEAMQYSRRKMQPFRENRLSHIRQYVGSNYSESGAGDKVPINLLEMAINIYRRQVVASRPQVLVSTKSNKLKAEAADFESVVNHTLDEIDFETTLQRWVLDAMFGLGVVKVGLAPGRTGEIDGFRHDVGQVFCDNVDFDDFCFDMTAKRWDQIQYCGNRYSLPYELVMDMKLFGNKDLIPNPYVRSTNEQGDDRASVLQTGGETMGTEQYMPVVELWDVWLPYENVIITMQADDVGGGFSSNEPLKIIDWDGPEIGPYHLMSYIDVPSNIMPLSPAGLLTDLHDIVNRLFRKLGRQAERQKTLTVVAGGAEEDGRRIVNANDGDTILSDRPEATKEMKFGGVDSPSLAFMIQLKDLFSYLGGNLDSLGGLAPSAKSGKHDSLLQQSASVRIDDMQARTTSAVKKVVESMADYIFYDPAPSTRIYRDIPKSDMSVKVDFNPEIREGDSLDYAVDIAPYSLQSRSPAERLQTINETMMQIIIPMSQQLQQRGIVPDMERYMEIMSKYSHTEEIADILKIADFEEMEQVKEMSGGGEGGTKAPVTERRYVRENVSTGGTRAGRDNAMVQTLMGGGNDNQIAAASMEGG
tara:strand:- start:1947 stop:3749 length:1803 start_codon:yes stop_codon:yes gene_type:complete